MGANYIEANESLSKKDFIMRIKICRKEAKESCYWLRLIDSGEDDFLKKRQIDLITEATELTSIFGEFFVTANKLLTNAKHEMRNKIETMNNKQSLTQFVAHFLF